MILWSLIITIKKLIKLKLILKMVMFIKSILQILKNLNHILSLSPESLIKVKNKMIYTAPIKGTRHRSNIPSVDLELKKELQNSIKDKAEHLMIVDLLRNDLGKICQIGSIKVNDLYNIKSFETIHHMVTEIEGKLKENISETDIIQALFPGGSITGAPKESAMSIIDNLEQSNRKIYTGSAGYIKSNWFVVALLTFSI